MKENFLEQNIKNERNAEVLASGADSTVYRIRDSKVDMVAKDYHKLANRVGVKVTERILQNYYAETERAGKIVEENYNQPPLQKVDIKGEEYSFHYNIVPQGGLVMDSTEASLFLEKTKNKKSLLVMSQKFIDGLNLHKLLFYNEFKGEQIPENQKVFVQDKVLLLKVGNQIIETFRDLTEKLGEELGDSPVNVKIFQNVDEKKIEVFITDLAASLRRYYLRSPKIIKE